MNSLPSKIDPALLAEEVARMDFKDDASGLHMAHKQGKGLPDLKRYPALRAALEEITSLTGGQVVSFMVNILDSGRSTPTHTDASGAERYHLPIQTNPDAGWWDEAEGHLNMRAWFWHGPVPFRIPHTVYNHGHAPRTHLIVDIS